MKGILEEIPKFGALTVVQVRDILHAIIMQLEYLDTESMVQLVTFCTKQMDKDDGGKEL